MKNLAFLLLAATSLAGCDDDDDNFDVDDDVDEGIEDVVDEANDGDGNFVVFTATITGVDTYAAISGVGRVLLDVPSMFTAEIDIRNDTPGAVRPWHVHFGNCASGGDIVGPPASYRPLTISANGTDAVGAQVTAPFDLAAPYHVNVHVSPTDMTVIACGDLRLL